MNPYWIFRALFVLTLAAITWLALTPDDLTGIATFWDKLNHFVAFFVLALLLDFSSRNEPHPLNTLNLVKATSLVVYMIGIECAQWYVGYRVFELADIVAGMLGLAAYGLAMPFTTKGLRKAI